MKDKDYENEILQWRARRYDALVSENGWLAVAGLFWLKKGRNLVGSNPMCEIPLPDRGPTFLGIIEVKGKVVRLQVASGVRVQVNDKLVQKAILKSSKEVKPSYINWDDIRMVLHEHAGRYAIRIWDNQREQRHSLPPLIWFPVNKHFRISARYTRYPNVKISDQLDTFGDMVEDRMDGYVTFNFEGTKYKLDVSETKDHKLFLKFKDLTSHQETYPAGRYYYTQPVQDGKVILDFNYSYSPPCAFSEYATCIFASQQNHLPFRIEAGEMYRR
jgi:uncharacterized protein